MQRADKDAAGKAVVWKWHPSVLHVNFPLGISSDAVMLLVQGLELVPQLQSGDIIVSSRIVDGAEHLVRAG